MDAQVLQKWSDWYKVVATCWLVSDLTDLPLDESFTNIFFKCIMTNYRSTYLKKKKKSIICFLFSWTLKNFIRHNQTFCSYYQHNVIGYILFLNASYCQLKMVFVLCKTSCSLVFMETDWNFRKILLFGYIHLLQTVLTILSHGRQIWFSLEQIQLWVNKLSDSWM